MINLINELKKELSYKAGLFFINKQEVDLNKVFDELKASFETTDHETIVWIKNKSQAPNVPNELFGLPTKVLLDNEHVTGYREVETCSVLKVNKLTLWQRFKYYFLDKIANLKHS